HQRWRRAHYPDRDSASAIAARRIAADLQHPCRAKELDWPAPGGRGAVHLLYRRNPLLSLPPCRTAGDHRLGPGQPGPCRQRGRGPRQAAVRFLLCEIFLGLARYTDRVPNDPDDDDGVWVALGVDFVA